MAPRDVLRFGIIGANGEKYMFGAPECPVRLHKTPQGLQGAPFDLSYSQTSRQDGETFKNRRFKRNPITLDVLFGRADLSGPHHRREHARWRAALGDATNTCRFVTVSGESGYRWKYCRLQAATQAVNWQRPGALGVEAETVALASDDAFWTHPDEARVFSKSEFTAASIHNPGDRPVWPTITLMGQTEGWALGFGGDLVEVPATYEGSYIRIHTDPEFPTATFYHDSEAFNLLPPFVQDMFPSLYKMIEGIVHEDLYERDDSGKGSPKPFPGARRDLIFREPLPAGGNGSGLIPFTIKAHNPQDSAQVMVEFTPKSVSAW